MKSNPKTSYIPPVFFLNGCYAYSHSMLWWANPPYKKLIPHLGAFYESPAKPGTFLQVQGFAVASFAGYICFDGAGNLNGSGVSVQGGNTSIPSSFPFTGTYTVDVDWSTGSAVYTGRFTTVSNDGTSANHFFVMADNWKELKFIMLDTYDSSNKPLRQPVTSGVLTRMHP